MISGNLLCKAQSLSPTHPLPPLILIQELWGEVEPKHLYFWKVPHLISMHNGAHAGNFSTA